MIVLRLLLPGESTSVRALNIPQRSLTQIRLREKRNVESEAVQRIESEKGLKEAPDNELLARRTTYFSVFTPVGVPRMSTSAFRFANRPTVTTPAI